MDIVQEPQFKKQKPLYLLGLLCIIPLVGAFVGLALLLYGIIKYKDKWLIIIGALGIAWSIFIYGGLLMIGKSSGLFKKGFTEIAQLQLTSLVKSVEFYKLMHGQYPDSLVQLKKDDPLVTIWDSSTDPLSSTSKLYYYKKQGEQYILLSVGNDGIPETNDDLLPRLQPNSQSQIGLLKYDTTQSSLPLVEE